MNARAQKEADARLANDLKLAKEKADRIVKEEAELKRKAMADCMTSRAAQVVAEKQRKKDEHDALMRMVAQQKKENDDWFAKEKQKEERHR